jgi:hypothetical protein
MVDTTPSYTRRIFRCKMSIISVTANAAKVEYRRRDKIIKYYVIVFAVLNERIVR